MRNIKVFFLAVGLSLYKFLLNTVIFSVIVLAIWGLASLVNFSLHTTYGNLALPIALLIGIFIHSFHQAWKEAKEKVK